MSRIFVIEDEEAINKLICTSLTVAGYETVPAYDGNEALAKLRDFERFDLALVDIMLPEVDGFEFARTVRQVTASPCCRILGSAAFRLYT